MADFRKWLLAFAFAALVLGVSTIPAQAQIGVGTGPAFICSASVAVPPLVRAEGITELVGDIVLNCTGGTPTVAGSPVPKSNIQIALNTNVTSRIYAGSGPTGTLSDALLIMDEAYPTAPNPVSAIQVPGSPRPEVLCQADGVTVCPGEGITDPTTGQPTFAGVPAGTELYGGGNSNVFQAVPTNNGTSSGIANAGVAFLGVPIDAPGSSAVRVIRITNIRANASALGVSSTLVPTQIFAYISINGSQQITISNPTQTVAYIVPGLIGGSGPATVQQCLPPTASPTFTFTEGFASSFKTRNVAQTTSGSFPASPLAQNVPGFPYNTETAFYNPGDFTTNPNIGLADHGTRLLVRFVNIQNGVTLTVPPVIPLVPVNTVGGTPTGSLVLVSTDANGDGPPGATPITNGQLQISGGTAYATYEVSSASPTTIETTGPVSVTISYTPNPAQNIPALGTSQAKISFAPLSTDTVADFATASVPRFIDSSTAANGLTINACTCDLLFPFVTNQAGFDTGVAIANTSQDPFGTITQAGPVTLYYYGNTGGTGAAPAAQTSQDVPAGQELIFTLSGGGNFGIAATPGFQGYLIAVANFQYCHAFAFISDIGAQRLAEGYLAIQLDEPGLPRTFQVGENKGH